jgi:hypothetical protein
VELSSVKTAAGSVHAPPPVAKGWQLREQATLSLVLIIIGIVMS